MRGYGCELLVLIVMPLLGCRADKTNHLGKVRRWKLRGGLREGEHAAQGLARGCPVISRDEALDQFGVSRVW
jgi:hypothetical protein